MATFPRITLLAIAAAAALVLSGCLAPNRDPTPSPVPSSSPIFASEDEALAAATKAYAAYQEAVDVAFATYETERLSTVAVEPALTTAIKSVGAYVDKGHRQVGSSSLQNVSLVDASALVENSFRGDALQIYACLNVGSVDVVDSNGVSIVPADRATLYPVIASLVWSIERSRLMVSAEEAWGGSNFCA